MGKTEFLSRVRMALILVCITTCFVSCTKPSRVHEQAFHELSLDTELASIAMVDDSVCVVGGEYGDLYFLVRGIVKRHLSSDEARIYGLYRQGDDTCFIGIRNKGAVRALFPRLDSVSETWLKYVDLSNSLPQYKQISNHNENNKGNQYSPYGFAKYDDDLIVTTTSNGLYSFNVHQRQDTLNFIPYLGNREGAPFFYCSPISIDNAIFIASNDGVVRIDRLNNSFKIHNKSSLEGRCVGLKNRCIVKLEMDEPMLYALSDGKDCDSLYVLHLANLDHAVDSCQLPFSALSMILVMGKFYFVNESSLYVVSNLNDIEHYVEIPLPHIVPSDTRNIMAYDTYSQQIRLVTRRAVLSFPSINGIGESDVVIQSCFDEITQRAYFLNTKKELYAYNPDGDGEAKKIMDLPGNEEVSDFYVRNDIFYYIANHRQLKKIENGGFINRCFHSFVCRPSKVCDLINISTSMQIEGDTAYVGVRDLLQKVSLASGESTKEYDSIKPYFTRLCKVDNNLYATTLNDGTLNLTKKDSINCNRRQFQNDFVVTGRGDSLLLDIHYLYAIGSEKIDSLRLDGYERLFLCDDTLGVAISRRGVQYFSLTDSGCLRKGLFYENYINPEACMVVADTLYLATDWGLMKMAMGDFLSPTPHGVIRFENKTTDWWGIIMWMVMAFLCFVVLFFLNQLRKKRVIQKLLEIIQNKDTRIQHLNNENEEKEAELQRVEKRRNELEIEITESKKEVEEKEKEVQRAKSESEKKEERVNELQEQQRTQFHSRLARLKNALPYIDDEKVKKEIQELESIISNEIVPFDDSLNQRIQIASAKVALALVEVVKIQNLKIEDLRWYESDGIIISNKNIINEKNTDRLIEVINENKEWIDEAKKIAGKLEEYEKKARMAVIIEDVTDNLIEEVASVIKAFHEEKKEQAMTKYNSLQHHIKDLLSSEKRERVRDFIFELRKVIGRDSSMSKLLQQLDNTSEQLNSENLSEEELFDIFVRLKRMQDMEIRKNKINAILEKMRSLDKLYNDDKDINNSVWTTEFENLLSEEFRKSEFGILLLNNLRGKSFLLLALVMAIPREEEEKENYSIFTGKIYSKLCGGSKKNKTPMSNLKSYLTSDQFKELLKKEKNDRILVDLLEKSIQKLEKE